MSATQYYHVQVITNYFLFYVYGTRTIWKPKPTSF